MPLGLPGQSYLSLGGGTVRMPVIVVLLDQGPRYTSCWPWYQPIAPLYAMTLVIPKFDGTPVAGIHPVVHALQHALDSRDRDTMNVRKHGNANICMLWSLLCTYRRMQGPVPLKSQPR